MRRSYVPLSEDEKITIIHHYKNLGRDWKHIGELVSRPPTTVASFIKSYLKHKTISPKRGKKNELSNTIIDSVISVSVGNPEACLQHQGACLNGKWADVHKYHAQYRTNLRIFGEIPA